MQTFWAHREWHFFTYLCHDGVILGFHDNHGEFWIFNEITALCIVNFEADASVAAKFVFFFKPNLDVNVFRNSLSNLLRRNLGTSFSCAASEVKEPND